MALQDLGKIQTLIQILPSCPWCMPVLYISAENIKKKVLTPSETIREICQFLWIIKGKIIISTILA